MDLDSAINWILYLRERDRNRKYAPELISYKHSTDEAIGTIINGIFELRYKVNLLELENSDLRRRLGGIFDLKDEIISLETENTSLLKEINALRSEVMEFKGEIITLKAMKDG